MKRILLIGLGFVVVQGSTFSSTAFASEAKKSKSTFVRPVTKKKVLVAFQLKDTEVPSLAGMTPAEIQADPQAAADLRQAERVQAVRNESVPDETNAL